MDCMVEDISFGYPDDMQGFLHIFRFDSVMAFNWSERRIRLGYPQPNIPFDYHLRRSAGSWSAAWNVRYLFKKGSLYGLRLCSFYLFWNITHADPFL